MNSVKASTGTVLLVIAFLNCTANAQKVKVGFDKTADFSKYHTFSWSQSEAAIAHSALRKGLVISEIETALEKKGLQRVDHSGQLTLDAQGSVDGELGGEHQQASAPVPNTPSSPMNTVWSGAPVAAGSYVLEGTLVLNFIDTATKSLVWEGSVASKLDHGNEEKNFKQIQKAIAKLMERFPPKEK